MKTTTRKITGTASEAMSHKAMEFEAHIEALRSAFYDLPAPETKGLNWGHVGSAGHVNELLKEAVEFLTH
jgi:hypothetical protein